MEKSFLGDYLPARLDTAVNLTQRDLTTLNANWSLPEKHAKDKKRELQVLAKSPLLGVNFQLHSEAKYLPGGGELVAERQLGRGRIVVTSFSLAAPAVRAWRSFDSFLNNVLLRRPSRTFDSFEHGYSTDVVFRWGRPATAMREPLLHSSLRLISRDLSSTGTSPNSEGDYRAFSNATNGVDEIDGVEDLNQLSLSDGRRDLEDHWHYGGYDVSPKSGVAGWNDTEGVAAAARATLQDAAGITPPSGNFVLQLLAGYLFVLVPVNWLIFWLVGKVEYAWIAAPIIAIVGALVVIRMASLDIGFSRSNTQVALLEIPMGYQRGHLTEYSALYTSLSTSYRVHLHDDASQALPFPANPNTNQTIAESLVPITLDKTATNEMSGMQIQSNSTELVHAEHILDVGGTIRIKTDDDGGVTLVNNSNIDLNNVLLVHRSRRQTDPITDGQTPDFDHRFWRVDRLDAKSQLAVDLESDSELLSQYRGNRLLVNAGRDAAKLWDQEIETEQATLQQLAEISELGDVWVEFSNNLLAPNADAGAELSVTRKQFLDTYERVKPTSYVSLGKVFDCVFDNLRLSSGEYRLYATTDQKLGRTNIAPNSTQTDRQTLIVAHLSYPRLPEVSRDANSVADLSNVSDLDRKKLELFQ